MQPVKYTHPRLLPFLFLTEMWERFGFYVAQGLLVLYLTGYYGFTDDQSFTISGIFGGLIYLSPFVGGFLADRILGFKTAIIWGGLFLILGYTLLALSNSTLLFYPALATIIVGNGFLKPNISSLLGTQYAESDPRRESGFLIFYIGINIGVAFSGASGYIKNAFGWHVTFATAAVGMIIGLSIFLFGMRYIKNVKTIAPLNPKFKYQLLMYCLLAILGLCFVLRVNMLATWLLPAAGLILLMYVVIITLQQNADYRQRLLILNILILFSIVFWMLFLQLFNSANLFISRLVDKDLFGIPLTTTVFYASESVFIIVLSPLFAWLWQSLGAKKKNPSPVTKFALGFFFAGIGLFLLGLSTMHPNDIGLINPLWIFGSYFFMTIGELLISPIGLSAVTLLAPANLVGMMMGIWFVGTGFGGIFAGLIAKVASVPESAVTIGQKLAIYQAAFFDYAYLAFFVAIVLNFVQLGLKKLLKTST